MIFDAAKAEVQETWNACLGNIEAAIEAMPTTPFTVFFRDNESGLDEGDQLTPKKLEQKIASGIQKLKTNILVQVLTNHGIMNPETDDLMGCLIYLLTIKKRAVVTNSINSESKKALVQSSVTVPFNFEAIKRCSAELYLDLNQNRIINGVLHDFSHRLQSRMAIIEEIKHHVSCLKVRKEAIIKLERGDISVLDSVDSIVQNEMKLKAEQTELETQLKKLDTDERVDKPGFPIRRTAWSYFFGGITLSLCFQKGFVKMMW